MFADERIATEPHPGQVERRRDVPRRGGEERIGHGSIEHGVAVPPVQGRVPRVEVIGRDLEGAHHDLRGTHGVHRSLQRAQIERNDVSVERDDLAPSVHARVGATGTGHRDGLT